MATVEKDINESSEKIDKVKRIVQDRALALEYKKQIPQTPIADGASWKDLEFSHPENTVRIGTVLLSTLSSVSDCDIRLCLLATSSRSVSRVTLPITK